MFTWICPQCGREVPPAYNDCPDCAARAAGAQTPPERQPGAVPPVEPEKTVEQTPAAKVPENVAPAPRPVKPAPSGTRVPTWLLGILFAFAFLGLGAGLYWAMGYVRGRSQAAPSASVESPAAKPGAQTNALQRYIEISGIRFIPDDRKKERTLTRFVVTNHSAADIMGLSGNVTLWGRTQKSEEDAQGTFAFTTDLRPYESKELTAPLETKLKIYELPDWQNATPDVQITAPAEASEGSPAPR